MVIKGMKQKKKVAYRITSYIMALQIIIFAVLYIFMSRTITGNIRENTIESMKTIVDDRSQIIESYVREAESHLTAYSRAGEITNLLLHSADPAAVAAAQGDTERFSQDIERLEGIYVSDTQTGEYIFNDDEEKLGQKAEEEFVINIVNEVKQSRLSNFTDYTEYSEEGKEHIAAYHYFPDRDWLFLLTDTADEIFATANVARFELLTLCIGGLAF